MKTSIQFFRHLAFFAMALILVTSCEDTDVFNPYDGHSRITLDRSGSLEQMKDLNASHFTFQVDADNGGVYYLPDDSRIIFYSGSFLLNGAVITNKKITIELDYVRSKKEMVENLLGTSSNGKIIETGGMVNVRAYCEGKPVLLDPAKGYILNIVAPTGNIPKEMEMFYGEETDKGINWVEADGDPSSQNTILVTEWARDSSGRFVIGMECFPKKFGWVNCDFFSKLNDQPLTNPCLIPKGPSNGDSIVVQAFAVFKSYNVIINPCCSTDPDEMCFGPLPVDADVYYIIIGKGKLGYYFGYVEKKVIVNDKVVIQIEPKTLQEIKDFLATL